jgi:branched-chain amino acid transport system ATP-binding protein
MNLAGQHTMLQVEGITKQIGGLTAVNQVDLTMEQGEIVGLVGPNGAGKTTLMNVISGILRPTKGRIIFFGEDITGFTPERICQKGISKTFQIPQSFPDLTARQAVMVGILFGDREHHSMDEARDIAAKLLEFVGLSPKKMDMAVKNLNVGELKRLQLGRALASRPQLLLLDELMTGLNPREINDAIVLLRQIQGTGVSILLIEHVMHVIMDLSDRIYVLDHGERIAAGTPEAVARDPRVIETYLGESFSG